MKRITALLMAVLMTLSALTACAESSGTRFEISNIRLSLYGSERKKQIKLKDISLSIAAGGIEGIPTLQLTLYSEEQLDVVAQVFDGRLLLSMGGVTGVYSVDFGTLIGDEAKGELLAAGIGAGVMMFGANPDAMLRLWMKEDKKGRLRTTIKLSPEVRGALAEQLESLPEWMAGDLDLESLHEELLRKKPSLKLKITYNPQKGKIDMKFLRGKEGLRLMADIAMTTGPVDFVNISADETQYDCLNLEEETLECLKDELDFMLMKARRFATGIHMEKLMPTDETAAQKE